MQEVAMARSTPQVLMRSSSRFSVNVVIDRCKECGLCIEVCPVKVLVRSDTYVNKYGYRPPEPKYIDKCIGCRLCEYTCPDFAIYVVKVGSQ